MRIRLRIQAKLLIAFLAVGLLSILVGVFMPLWVISLRSPEKSKERLFGTRANILSFYEEYVGEPQSLGAKLNQWPEVVQAFEARDLPGIHRLLHQYEQELGGYTFLIESEREMVPQLPRERTKVRFVKVLETAEEFLLWQERLAPPEGATRAAIRLIPRVYAERIYYLAGGATPIQDADGKILGGLLLGAALIGKDLKQVSDPDYRYDRDYFSNEFEAFHDVSIEVIGAESQPFRAFTKQIPQLETRLFDKHQVCYLEEVRISNVASQILLVPVEDISGNLISILYLHLPLPPETYAWQVLMGTFYYGIAIAAVLALVTAYLVSRTISRPIKQLSEGALALSRGDLDYQVSVDSEDEVGDLARIFVEMRRRLGQTLEEVRRRAETIAEKNIALDQSLAEISRMRDFTEDILRSIDGGVITFDLAGQVTKVNRAARRILRLSDDLTEDNVREHLPEAIRQVVGKVLRSGQTVEHAEMEVERAGAERVPIDLGVSLLKSQERTIGAVATFYDLSQVRSLKEQIRRQEHLAALGTLSAGVAHEIRNPLGIIRGSAEILRKRFGHLREEEGLSEFILEEVKRLSAVVTDFLDFARPKPPHFVPEDLGQVLRRSLQLANLPTSYPKVQVSLALEPGLPPIEIDPEQCQQAFLNLILNAAQAMPEGGRLSLGARFLPDSREIEVDITDSGPGIDDGIKPHIFNPFFTTKDTGTGLGLSIVHRIVENHQAHITVASSGGKGSTFRIRFPLDRAGRPPRATVAATGAAQSRKRAPA